MACNGPGEAKCAKGTQETQASGSPGVAARRVERDWCEHCGRKLRQSRDGKRECKYKLCPAKTGQPCRLPYRQWESIEDSQARLKRARVAGGFESPDDAGDKAQDSYIVPGQTGSASWFKEMSRQMEASRPQQTPNDRKIVLLLSTDYWSWRITDEMRQAMKTVDDWASEADTEMLKAIGSANHHLLQCGDTDVNEFHNKVQAILARRKGIN